VSTRWGGMARCCGGCGKAAVERQRRRSVRRRSVRRRSVKRRSRDKGGVPQSTGIEMLPIARIRQGVSFFRAARARTTRASLAVVLPQPLFAGVHYSLRCFSSRLCENFQDHNGVRDRDRPLWRSGAPEALLRRLPPGHHLHIPGPGVKSCPSLETRRGSGEPLNQGALRSFASRMNSSDRDWALCSAVGSG